MKSITILSILLSAMFFSLNANAFDCEKIKARKDKVCGKKSGSRKCAKLTAKADVCEKGGGKEEWKSARGQFKSDWKSKNPNSGGGDPAKKCERIKRKQEKVCARKAGGKRCQKLTSKLSSCSSGAPNSGFSNSALPGIDESETEE